LCPKLIEERDVLAVAHVQELVEVRWAGWVVIVQDET
jgi:hypothetical protein